MGINSGFELVFRRVVPEDAALLERWYGMTNYFGYATGFKRFSEINQVLLEPMSRDTLVLMIETGIDKKTIGFIYGEFKVIDTQYVFWIYTLIIDPAFQRKGFGTRVVNKILDSTKMKYGSLTCFVAVSDKNIQGLTFWQKTGFSHSDRMEESLNQNGASHVAILKRKIK